MTAPAATELRQQPALQHLPLVAWRPLRALALLAAGMLVVCQYAASASAQSRSPSTKAPLPTPAPQLQDAKPKAAELPPPDVWTESEIADARRICTNALKTMTAEVKELQPIKKGPCGAPAPVRLISIGKKNPVKFVPAPTISCRMLVPLKRWIERGLQPAAARNLDTLVTTVSVMSSYSCRTRYGRKGAKMSEHAFANALDIGGFRLADGGRVSVLKDWGPTRRDIEKAVAAAKAEKLRAAKAGPTVAPISEAEQPANQRSRAPKVASRRPKEALPEVRIDRRSKPLRAEPRPRDTRRRDRARYRRYDERRAALSDQAPLDRPTRRRGEINRAPNTSGAFGTTGAFGAPAAIPAPALSPPPLPVRRPLRRAVRSTVKFVQPSTSARRKTAPPRSGKFKAPFRLGGPKPAKSSPRSVFLRTIHQTACRIFGTTLGPEANEAHRNHFHFDMFPRKRRGYCE